MKCKTAVGRSLSLVKEKHMNHSTTVTATVTDPVCGMTIDPANAVGSSSYNGQMYHFCSQVCQTKFDSAPTEYVSPNVTATESASC